MSESMQFWVEIIGVHLLILFLLIIIRRDWNDKRFILIWNDRFKRDDLRDYTLIQALKDYYGGIVSDFRYYYSFCEAQNPSLKSRCQLHIYDQKRLYYEFGKVFRCSTFEIYPTPGTPELERFYYGDYTVDEWHKMHPEQMRYGLGYIPVPNKIKHPFVPKPADQRAKLIIKNGSLHGKAMDASAVDLIFDRKLAEIAAADNVENFPLDWEEVLNAMDPELVQKTHDLVAPCPQRVFINAYLSLSDKPLVIETKYKSYFRCLSDFYIDTYGRVGYAQFDDDLPSIKR